jgi:hypothetical protein
MKTSINKNNIDPEQMLPEVETLLRQLAWRISEPLGIPYQETLAEAYFLYMRACKTYDPTKGSKFSTWVYFVVEHNLRNFARSRLKKGPEMVELDEDICGTVPEKSPIFDFIEDLPRDARILAKLLIETPTEILNGSPISPKDLLKRVRLYMVERGWKWDKILLAQEQLQLRLGEMYR